MKSRQILGLVGAAVGLFVLLTLLIPLMGRMRGQAASRPEFKERAFLAAPAASDQQATGEEIAASSETASPAAGRKIITNGEMSIRVKNLDEALAALTQLVQQTNGFFAHKSIVAGEQWRRADVRIRVPADQFEKLHTGAKELGDVTHDLVEREDVTKQWQDLEARLKIRRAEEQALLQLMQQQARLSDLLAVEKRLWEVREQIEQAEGELRFLRDRVTLATLMIQLEESIPAGVGPLGPWNLGYHLQKAWRALLSGLRQIVVACIYIALPGAIVWAPLAIVLFWIKRKKRRLKISSAEED